MELKNIRIFVCATGTGKTYLSNNDERFVDLDNIRAVYKYNLWDLSADEREKNKGNRCQTIKQDSTEYIEDKLKHFLNETDKILLFAPHPEIMDMIYKNHFPYCLIYYLDDCKEEIRQRMFDRGNSEKFINSMLSKLKEYNDTYINDTRPDYKIILNKGEFLSDILYKVLNLKH